MINSDDIKAYSKKSTASFWKEKRHELKLLYQFSLVLNSIPASSAFIERFFSISGLYSKKKAMV